MVSGADTVLTNQYACLSRFTGAQKDSRGWNCHVIVAEFLAPLTKNHPYRVGFAFFNRTFVNISYDRWSDPRITWPVFQELMDGHRIHETLTFDPFPFHREPTPPPPANYPSSDQAPFNNQAVHLLLYTHPLI
ncbi:hypothetical protein J6590_015189 [Homalodisca vitripennis]|nr:hypothetical protein J6590_015189 [Homalodisca vitripennis]